MSNNFQDVNETSCVLFALHTYFDWPPDGQTYIQQFEHFFLLQNNDLTVLLQNMLKKFIHRKPELLSGIFQNLPRY